MSGKMARRLAACLLNVSEGRNQLVVNDIAKAAVSNQELWLPESSVSNTPRNTNVEYFSRPNSGLVGGEDTENFRSKATVLNIFADVEYNRSVITLAAPIEFLGACIFQACEEAFKTVDLLCQQGAHPRLGSVDLIPIHPLSSTVSLEDCGKIARKVGNQIVEKIPHTSVFFFGDADLPQKRGLVQRRKEMNWYSGKHEQKSCDVGDSAVKQYGITGIGAIPYMTNFNISIETKDLGIGNSIAKAIRGSSPGGLLGVQSMAFPHGGMVEIACNVETMDLQKVVSYTGRKYATFDDIENRIAELCNEVGIKVSGSVVIGFTPEEAYTRTVQSLIKGETFEPKKFDERRM